MSSVQFIYWHFVMKFSGIELIILSLILIKKMADNDRSVIENLRIQNRSQTGGLWYLTKKNENWRIDSTEIADNNNKSRKYPIEYAYANKCSDRSMKVLLLALKVNYDRQTHQPTPTTLDVTFPISCTIMHFVFSFTNPSSTTITNKHLPSSIVGVIGHLQMLLI